MFPKCSSRHIIKLMNVMIIVYKGSKAHAVPTIDSLSSINYHHYYRYIQIPPVEMLTFVTTYSFGSRLLHTQKSPRLKLLDHFSVPKLIFLSYFASFVSRLLPSTVEKPHGHGEEPGNEASICIVYHVLLVCSG